MSLVCFCAAFAWKILICLVVFLFFFGGVRDSTVTTLSWIIRCSFQVLLELFFIFSSIIFSSSKQKLKQGDHCNLITTNPFVNFFLCLITCRDLPASALLFLCVYWFHGFVSESAAFLCHWRVSFLFLAFSCTHLCADEAALGFI